MTINKRSPVIGLDVVSDEVAGGNGFLTIRRMVLCNRREDNTFSDRYSCDFAVRSRGTDAVVVALFHRDETGIQVLVRRGLRPAMTFGRSQPTIPVADRQSYLFFTELVAGILEDEDQGIDGIRRRAAIETWEEAGYHIAPEDVIMLGAGTFPTPGAMPEKFWLTAVEIDNPSAQEPLEGDGSPMEESATTQWFNLNDAIASCVSGEIEDAKTELTLRRLVCYLANDLNTASRP